MRQNFLNIYVFFVQQSGVFTLKAIGVFLFLWSLINLPSYYSSERIIKYFHIFLYCSPDTCFMTELLGQLKLV